MLGWKPELGAIFFHLDGDCVAEGAQFTLYCVAVISKVSSGRAGPKLAKQICSESDLWFSLTSAEAVQASPIDLGLIFTVPAIRHGDLYYRGMTLCH